MHGGIKIQTGGFLLAEPFMWDSHFRRAVVVLTEHGEHGTHGFMLNKPIGIALNDVLASFPKFDAEVHYGGPVATDTLHFIHTAGDLLSQSHKVRNGLWWGGDLDELVFLVRNDMITPNDVRFFVGYTGWSPGQLYGELADGAWLTDDGDLNYIFKSRTRQMWREILHNRNGSLGVIGDMREQNFWN